LVFTVDIISEKFRVYNDWAETLKNNLGACWDERIRSLSQCPSSDFYRRNFRVKHFFTWQYDIRWAANLLRRSGLMKPAESSPHGLWELSGKDH